MIRVAAVGDVHLGPDDEGMFAPALRGIEERADVLLLAGDLTKCGTVEEAEVAAREVAGVPVPVVAVLGNHDHHAGEPDGVAAALEGAGVTVVEGDAAIVEVRGSTVGVAGVKGFGGGFWGASASAFGEPEMKAFVQHAVEVANRLENALWKLDTDVRIALLHYSPVAETLIGERPEIYPFLGSYLLAEAIDRAGAHLAVHGHAHAGSHKGSTPGGVAVRNVARPVISEAYRTFTFAAEDGMRKLVPSGAGGGIPSARA